MFSPFKILVDSRDATTGNSNSFSLTLKEAIHLHKDTVCYVNHASVSNTFIPVGTQVSGLRHYFYWFERIAGNDTVFNRASLPERGYDAESLATALQTAINGASWFGDGLYTVAYNEESQTATISRPDDGSRSFFVPSDSLLALPAFQAQTNPRTAGYTPYTVNWSDPQSALGLFGLGKSSSASLQLSSFMQLLSGTHLNFTQTTGALDIRRAHNVYVRSNALASTTTVGPPFARTLLVKIPCDALPGEVLSRTHSGHHQDYIECGNRMLSTLDFQITDYDNNQLDLRGGQFSCELLFCPRPI